MIGKATGTDRADWSSHVERALALSGDAGLSLEAAREPARDVGPALERIARGMAAIYDAADGRREGATSLSAAHGKLFEAAIGVAHAGLPETVTMLRDACAELIAAEEKLSGAPIAAVEGGAAAELSASGGVPRVHVVPRASLVPVFRAPRFRGPKEVAAQVAMAAPRTFEELKKTANALMALAEEKRKALTERLSKPVQAPVVERGRRQSAGEEEPPPGFAEVPSPALSEDDFARKWGRECFEETGMLGVQRAPLPGDDWRSCGTLEVRMSRAIDALAALGPAAVAHVERLALDAPAPDPVRMFAAAMIAGSIAGRDALGVGERVLRHFGAGDPVVAGAFGAAWRLAPHPLLPRVLREMGRSKKRGERALAIGVLADRGWLTASELSEIVERAGWVEGEAPEVIASVLAAMGATRHVDLERAATGALESANVAVQLAAVDGWTLAGSARAREAARRLALSKGGESALVRLALVAGEEDALWLVERLREKVSPGRIEAVGWAGHVGAVPLLIDLLESGDDDARSAAGAALDRILGVGLTDAIEISPEALDEPRVADPDPEPPAARRSLEEIVDDARDRAPAGSKETLVVPSVSAERWRRAWAEMGSRMDPQRRWRRGQGHGAAVCLHELDRLPLGMEERRCLQRELVFRTGRFVRFDPHDFVAAQEESLEAWGVVVGAVESAPGAW